MADQNAVALPQGYTLDAPPANAVALPDGYTLAQPETGWTAAADNVATGLQNGVGNLFGLPHTVGALGDKAIDYVGQKLGAAPDNAPGFVTRHTFSPDDVNSGLYAASNATNQAMGLPPVTPYQPQTGLGRTVQAGLGGIVPSLVGGGGAAAALGRAAAGFGGGAAADVAAQKMPDSTIAPLIAGVVGAATGGGAAGIVGAAGGGALNTAARAVAPTRVASRAVANELADAAGTSGPDLVSTIDQNQNAWTPGTRPTLANVTENDGLRNLEYADQAAAARSGDTTYQTNSRITNAAQRTAVNNVTPDAAQTINDLSAARDQAVSAIPAGIPAQQAGAEFRQNLQQIYDQRAEARGALGSGFDALQNSDAQINLRPVMDYATKASASNAGEVGDAYTRALGQFKTPTGITLDTAPFANSVLKGLGDLANSYVPGSAAQRAVLDVKSQAEQSVMQQAPEVNAARQAWANASRPLDVFQTRPFAQALATDRFGRGYTMPNDAVVGAFLRGRGTPDSLDALNNVFSNPEASTRALQDYISGQVRQNAVMADGSIDPGALSRTLQPYQSALMRFPKVAQTFRTAEGAQSTLDQQQAYQRLYNTFSTGLGTMERDAQGNPMYSPAQFTKAVQQVGPLLDQAYGADGANVIRRVDAELQNIAQTPYAKVKGQSGTPQILGGSAEGSGSRLGNFIGTVGGALLEHTFGEAKGIGAGAAIVGGKIGEQVQELLSGNNANVAAKIDQMRRQALTDPAFARSLLVKYDPRLPSQSGNTALRYALERIGGPAAATVAATPESQDRSGQPTLFQQSVLPPF